MLKNKWLVCCLLIGSVLATSIISTIPMFSDGILQKVLIGDLDQLRTEQEIYPGVLTINTKSTQTAQNTLTAAEKFDAYNDYVADQMVSELGLTPAARSTRITMSTLDMLRAELVKTQEQYDEDYKAWEEKKAKVEATGSKFRESEPAWYDESDSKTVNLVAYEDIENHVEITQGRMFDPSNEDVIELIMTESSAVRNGMVLDKEYVFFDYYGRIKEPIRCKVVGLFTYDNPEDPYWFDGLSSVYNNCVMPFSTMLDRFVSTGTSAVTQVSWNVAVDYTQIPLSVAERFLTDFQMLQHSYGNIFELSYNTLDTLKAYLNRRDTMSATLWSLQAPIILLLVFYIFMVSQLIIEQEKNEIAVLKSRGSSNGQVFMTYFIESLVLGAIAWVVGPLIGYGICKVLGLSDGFLELVNRSSLPVTITPTAYLYSLLAVLIFVVAMMVPVMLTTRLSIVKLKQSKARGSQPFWKKFFLDFICMGVSIFYLYSANSGAMSAQQLAKLAGLSASEAPVNPLSYISSTLFVLGVGMFFLRIYPVVLKAIFSAGRRFWSPVAYSALTNVSRAQSQNFFLMLFLILTISVGVLNANTARTMNENIKEKIMFNTGADLVVEQAWSDDMGIVSNRSTTSTTNVGGMYVTTTSKPDYSSINFVEPVNLFEGLDGVAACSEVYTRDSVRITGNSKNVANIELMGIKPYTFGQVAWFRSDLLKYHINSYLNLLASDNRACLLSTKTAQELNVGVGDYVDLAWGNQASLQCIVFGLIDNWPTVDTVEQQNFVVCNLEYIMRNMKLEPYKLWIKKAEGVTTSDIYNEIKQNKISYVSLTDANQLLIENKNDPLVTGTNGTLTLGFIITMTVSAIGFLIFWILNVKSRVLQFGILRSMGMTKGNVIMILVLEQVFLSLAAIMFGFLLGDITSELFIPLLNSVGAYDYNMPPFKVVWEAADYLKIYGVVGVMMVIDLVVLSTFVSKIKMNQALKLGED